MVEKSQYQTEGKVVVDVEVHTLPYELAIESLIDQLDNKRGALYSSNFEYPERYTRWDVGFVNPPLVISCQSSRFTLSALNERGQILLTIIAKKIKLLDEIDRLTVNQDEISADIKLSNETVPEELRSRQPTIFSVIRTIIDLFRSTEDDSLGLYGAFGYDLVYQFEKLQKSIERDDKQRDMVLYLPDELYVVDHRRQEALHKQYDFSEDGKTTKGLQRKGDSHDLQFTQKTQKRADHEPGEYAEVVRVAKEKFKKGDLFEVVPGQTFFENCTDRQSEIFRRLRARNPSPYSFLINLGESEYLVGASPEMYVRVTGKKVETCPISGTIKRGQDAIADSENILTLLNSKKEKSELTMCTDVDRNDKSRICEPGSVQVIGRRQIEIYSRLIHTVDHVIGTLREGYDALDAFLSHMWVVTVTGAPKLWAMQFIEDHERSPRKWYAGSVGWLGFNGNLNTGLTIRTIRLKEGVAEIRAGATLLYDSDPDAEENETHVKASAFIDAIRRPLDAEANPDHRSAIIESNTKNKKAVLIDHQDSFVHTLANYLRQTGANISTYRFDTAESELMANKPDLIVLSPGPGCPSDFNTQRTIDLALKHQLPVFGVCLGLQAIVEYFGGKLGILDYPVHGKPSVINKLGGRLFEGLPDQITIGRYHSLYAIKDSLPDELIVTAETEDGVIMAIEHRSLPISAVQFHPESILSLEGDVGLKMIHNIWGKH